MNKIDLKKFHLLETVLWIGVIIILIFAYFFLPRSALSDAIKIIALIALFFCSCGYFVYRNLFQSQTEFVESVLAENVKGEDHTSMLQDIFEHSESGMVLLDTDHKIILVSDSLSEDLGYVSKELIGLSFEHMFTLEFDGKMTLAKAVLDSPSEALSCKLKTKSDKQITINMTVNKFTKNRNRYSALLLIKKTK
jgi:PAS domain S-box-containing protein